MSTSRTLRSTKADDPGKSSPKRMADASGDSGVRTSSRLKKRSDSLSSLDSCVSSSSLNIAWSNSQKEADMVTLTQPKRSSSRLSQNASEETVSTEQKSKRYSSRTSKILEAVDAEGVDDNTSTARPTRSSSRLSQTSPPSENKDDISLSQQARRSNSRTIKMLDAVENPPATRSSSRLSEISEAESIESLSNVTTRRYSTRAKKVDNDVKIDHAPSRTRSSSRLSQVSDCESLEDLTVTEKAKPSRSTRSTKQTGEEGTKEKVISEIVNLDNDDSESDTASVKGARENKRESRRLSVRAKSALEDIQEVQDETAPIRRSTRLRRDSETSDTIDKTTPVKSMSRRRLRRDSETSDTIDKTTPVKSMSRRRLRRDSETSDTIDKTTPVKSTSRRSMMCSRTLDRIPDEDENKDESSPKKQSRKDNSADPDFSKIDGKTGCGEEPDEIKISENPRSLNEASKSPGNQLYSLISSEISRVSSSESLIEAEEKSESMPKEKQRAHNEGEIHDSNDIEIQMPEIKVSDAEKEGKLSSLSLQTRKCVVDLVDCNKNTSPSKVSEDSPSSNSSTQEDSSPQTKELSSDAVQKINVPDNQEDSASTVQNDELVSKKVDEALNPVVSLNDSHLLSDENDGDKNGSKYFEGKILPSASEENKQNLTRKSEHSSVAITADKDPSFLIEDEFTCRKSFSPVKKVQEKIGSSGEKKLVRKSGEKSPTKRQVSPCKSLPQGKENALSPVRRIPNVDSPSPAKKSKENDSSKDFAHNQQVEKMSSEKVDSSDSEQIVSCSNPQSCPQSETVQPSSEKPEISPKKLVKAERKSMTPSKKVSEEMDRSVHTVASKEDHAKEAESAGSKQNQHETALDKLKSAEDKAAERTPKSKEAELKDSNSNDNENAFMNEGSDSDDPELITLNFSEDEGESDDSSNARKKDVIVENSNENDDTVILDVNTESQTSETDEEIAVNDSDDTSNTQEMKKIGSKETSEDEGDDSVDSDDENNSEKSINDQSVVVLNKKTQKNKRVSFSNDVQEPKKPPKKSTIALLSDPDYVSKIQNYINTELQSRQHLKEISKLSNPKVIHPKRVEKPNVSKKDKPKQEISLVKPNEKWSKKIKIDELPKPSSKISSDSNEQTSKKKQSKSAIEKSIEKKQETTTLNGGKSASAKEKLILKSSKPRSEEPSHDNSKPQVVNDASSLKDKSTLVEKSKIKRKTEEKVTAAAPKKPKSVQPATKLQGKLESVQAYSSISNKPKCEAIKKLSPLKQKAASTMNFQVSVGKTKPVLSESLSRKPFNTSLTKFSHPNKNGKAEVIPACWGKILVENNPLKTSLKSKSIDSKNKWEIKPSNHDLSAHTSKSKKIGQTFSISSQVQISDKDGKKEHHPNLVVSKILTQAPTQSEVSVQRSIKPAISDLTSETNQAQNILKKNKRRNKKKSKGENKTPTELMKSLADNFVTTKKISTTEKLHSNSKDFLNWPLNKNDKTANDNEDSSISEFSDKKTKPLQLAEQKVHSNTRKLGASDIFHKKKMLDLDPIPKDTTGFFNSFEKKKHDHEAKRKRKLLTAPGSELSKPSKIAHLEPVKDSHHSKLEQPSNNKSLKTLPEEFLKKLSHQPQLPSESSVENQGKKKKKKNKKKKKTFPTTVGGAASTSLGDDFIPLSGSNTKFKVVLAKDGLDNNLGISHFKNQRLQKRDKKREPVQNLIAYRQKMKNPEKSTSSSMVF